MNAKQHRERRREEAWAKVTQPAAPPKVEPVQQFDVVAKESIVADKPAKKVAK